MINHYNRKYCRKTALYILLITYIKVWVNKGKDL